MLVVDPSSVGTSAPVMPNLPLSLLVSHVFTTWHKFDFLNLGFNQDNIMELYFLYAMRFE